ncbi:hypothetical protein PIB30_072063 [Stylosanthes scabra]|uniref:Uncharacterized protein n=1 Tax=Stylosanthes scabra TaxID=79078 RepID=A0ABU6SQB1_9FABA|nr:hypothetical protein [Stylosanthes scabra]
MAVRKWGWLSGENVTDARIVDRVFANFEQATQQAQEESDESADTVYLDVVWRQILSKPYKNRVYGAGGFFAGSLRTSGCEGSSASAASSQVGPVSETEVTDLTDKVQNLTHSLENQGKVLQHQIDEVLSLKNMLAERDARIEDHLQRMEAMQRQMVTIYDPLRPGSSIAGGSGSSTAPPLPRRPPPQQAYYPFRTMATTMRMHRLLYIFHFR